MTTDTQTAFVLVPREPTDEMLEASVSPRDEFLTDAHVSVLKDGFAAKYRAMLSAAPKPPESEIGPVAWRVKPWRHHGSEWMLTTVVPECAQEEPAQPLYPQARIDADAAIIAALRAEVERLQSFADGYGKLDADFAIAERRAESAEADREACAEMLKALKAVQVVAPVIDPHGPMKHALPLVAIAISNAESRS